MAVLVIRAHKRFAVCRKARLEAGRAKAGGLLIELSLDGCRIGNVAANAFAEGDVLTVKPSGGAPFQAAVRWIGEGTIGLRLTRPFHVAELDRLIRVCRGEFDAPAQRAFGT